MIRKGVGLLSAPNLQVFLRRLSADFGVAAVKCYQVVPHGEGGEQRRIYFIRHFSAHQNVPVESSFLAGRDIPPPGPPAPVDLTDMPMQAAIYGQQTVLVNHDSRKNKRKTTVIIVPRVAGRNLTGIYVFEFKAAPHLSLAEIKAIANQLDKLIRLADQEEIQAIREHDSLNFLNCVKLSLHLLSGSVGNPKYAAKLPDLCRRAEHNLKGFMDFDDNIKALLEFVQTGRICLRRSKLNLVDFFEGIRARFADDLEIGFNLEDAGRAEVYFDQPKLLQVLMNLINNSKKYCRADLPLKVKITCRATEDRRLQIIYEDNGQGIEAKNFAGIFLYRFMGDARTDQKSTGLGLYIVRILLAMHAGTIKVESVKGRGARFTIELPLP